MVVLVWLRMAMLTSLPRWMLPALTMFHQGYSRLVRMTSVDADGVYVDGMRMTTLIVFREMLFMLQQ
eukprot:9324169-Prorocentrum_lima.AAC.1